MYNAIATFNYDFHGKKVAKKDFESEGIDNQG
jgi:hypothetical protein